MFGSLTTECEKVRSERAIPSQNKTKSCEEGHVYIECFDS